MPRTMERFSNIYVRSIQQLKATFGIGNRENYLTTSLTKITGVVFV
jgi:hypothetical protein